MENGYVTESILEGWKQQIKIEQILHKEKTQFQELAIVESKSLGRVLVLGDRIQLTTKDEFIYHEMLAHVPIVGHGSVTQVLIIGGGDGGALRECLKHKNVHVTLVEIDEEVIKSSKQFLPTVHQGSFDNPRATVIIGDGVKFVNETEKKFEVIIVDRTDPVEHGPGAGLYQKPFYMSCKNCLVPGGILVTQNGHPQWENYPKETLSHLVSFFKLATVYQFCVPTYIGGLQTIAWASDNNQHFNLPVETLIQRWKAADIHNVQHYTPFYHKSVFVLPRWLEEQVGWAKSH